MGVTIADGFDQWGEPNLEPESPDDGVDFIRSWKPVDLATVLDGTWQPPEPNVGCRSDGVGLFYPGKVHTAASETEAGKTWFALSAAVDEMAAGNAVVYLDFEDDEGGIAGRLLTLGLNRNTIATRFHYVRPTDPLGGGIHRDDLDGLIVARTPSLAVIDGITEAMTLHGLDPLSNKDAAVFERMLPRRIATRGPAVVCLDHVTKSSEGRGRYALGAVHKLNGLDGAAYVLDSRTPFGIGLKGISTVKIAKDRPGQLRKHGLPWSDGMSWFGDLVLDSRGETFAEVSIETPHDNGDFRPTVLMARISDALTKAGRPLTKSDIEDRVTGRSQMVRQALAALMDEGFVEQTRGPHNSLQHTLLRSFDKGDN